jgi:hypothetical protein
LAVVGGLLLVALAASLLVSAKAKR